jgi:pumilio homology domain family member 6
MTKGFNKENQTNTNSEGGSSKPRGKFNKGKSAGNDNGIKYVKGERRRTTVDENTKNLRRLYNRLMQKSKDSKNKKEVNKSDLVSKVLKIINGNYAESCFKHDGCRVLQGSIKYGDKKQRYEIIKNLIPHVYDLIIKKYSIYLAVKMYKYAEPKQKEEIISQSVYPNFVKLMKGANGQAFLNFVFTNSGSNIQNGLVDYYMSKYLKITEDKLKAIKSVNEILIKKSEGEEMTPSDPTDPSNDVIIHEKQGTFAGESVKDDLKAHLEKQLEKNIHKNYIFQSFLNKAFDYLDWKTKLYVSELFDDDLGEFLQNRPGVELACKIFTVASAKTRKKVIKKIKDNLKSMTSNETSVLFLIKIILFNDDTKLVEKHIIKTLMEECNDELMQNKTLFKIICNIISPFNTRVNNPYENKILTYKEDSGSKKDEAKRHEELLTVTLDDIFNMVNPNVKFYLTDQTYTILLVELINLLIKNKDTEKLREILKNISSTVQIDYQNNFDDLDNTLLSEKTPHFVINRIMKSVKDLEEICDEFYKALSDVLLNNLDGYLNTKAIFIIVTIAENPKTKKFIESALNKFRTYIKNQAGEKDKVGFQLLGKILNK